jgi:hypothetical protein
LLEELLQEYEQALGVPQSKGPERDEIAVHACVNSVPDEVTFFKDSCELNSSLQPPVSGNQIDSSGQNKSLYRTASKASVGEQLFEIWREDGEEALQGKAVRTAHLCTRVNKTPRHHRHLLMHHDHDCLEEDNHEGGARKKEHARSFEQKSASMLPLDDSRPPWFKRSMQHGCNRFVLNPFSRKRVSWDMAGFAALAWDLFQVPVAVFSPPEDDTFWVTLGWIATVYWTLDIPASCMVGYFDRLGNLTMNWRCVVKRYLKTWFFFDVLMVSLDWARIFLDGVETASKSSRILKVLRFVRTFRLLRLFRSSKMKDAVLALQEEIDSPFIDPIFAMCTNAVMILCAAHFIACAWFGTGVVSSNKGNWVEANEMDSLNFATKYLETYRMALTFSFGRNIWIAPQNDGEIIFMIAMKLVGLMVFSTFVGGVTSRLTKIRELVEQESTQLFHLKQYLKDNRTSLMLKERVIRYAEYARQQHKKCRRSEDVVLLGLISGPLHVELETEVHKPYLIINPFMKEYSIASPAALSQLCFSCLKEETLARSDTLFRRGEACHRMFILKSGVLCYRLESKAETRAITVRKGYWFCEPALWLPWVHRARMKAMIEADLIYLDSVRFRDSTACHPSVRALCCSHAAQFYSHLNARPGDVWDVPPELLDPMRFADASHHEELNKIEHVHPMGTRFAKIISKAEEMSASLIHDESSDDEFEDEDDEYEEVLENMVEAQRRSRGDQSNEGSPKSAENKDVKAASKE